MAVNKAEYNKLVKAHIKKLAELHKENITDEVSPLDYFVASLQFLRDQLILVAPLEVNGQDNPKITSLATAIQEYQAYTNCIHKYFNISGNTITPKGNKDKSILLAKFNEEKQFHWDTFWVIVKDNIEDWRLN